MCEIPDDADLCPGWRFVLNMNEHEQYDPESYYYDQMYDVAQLPEIDGDEINGEDWQDARYSFRALPASFAVGLTWLRLRL